MSVKEGSTQKGDALEVRIYDLLKEQINGDQFFAKKECCKIFRRKGYYSKDRGSNIVFDVSIEVYFPGSDEYSLLYLVECKNYSHAVPVDDVEEFYTKVQQVASANCKAVIASTASFQSGSRSFAKSKGVGLLRLFGASDLKWELRRSASASARSILPEEAPLVEDALSQQEFVSNAFDMYFQSPIRETNSLWDFFEDMAVHGGLTVPDLRRISNSRNSITNHVPFLQKEDLENLGKKILEQLDYKGGMVDLGALCVQLAHETGLLVNFDVPFKSPDIDNPVLGRIQFEPLIIDVFAQDSENIGRDRFTLSHELAHLFLDHGKYLIRESCVGTDFVLENVGLLGGSDMARMEFQANYLAASILLPREYVLKDFASDLLTLGLTNKGFGYLYVDDQACNRQSYQYVTGNMMRKYGVSRTAAKIRLESMGLLRDKRQSEFSSVVQTISQKQN